jgi:hypothetical protein
VPKQLSKISTQSTQTIASFRGILRCVQCTKKQDATQMRKQKLPRNTKMPAQKSGAERDVPMITENLLPQRRASVNANCDEI